GRTRGSGPRLTHAVRGPGREPGCASSRSTPWPDPVAPPALSPSRCSGSGRAPSPASACARGPGARRPTGRSGRGRGGRGGGGGGSRASRRGGAFGHRGPGAAREAEPPEVAAAAGARAIDHGEILEPAQVRLGIEEQRAHVRGALRDEVPGVVELPA